MVMLIMILLIIQGFIRFYNFESDLQATRDPKEVIAQMLRIAKYAIISVQFWFYFKSILSWF